MSFYASKILPRLTDYAMRGDEINALRAETLASARGRALEVGFGTGMNARHYPAAVDELVVVDDNPGMSALALERLAGAHRQARHEVLSGEALPFADASFDTVVVTFTLCSIEDVDRAVREMRRVLAPEGRLLFLEHNVSDVPDTRRTQRRITPLWRRIAGNCHLDRDAPVILERNGFVVDDLVKTRLSTTSPLFGTIRRGVARAR